MGFRQDLKHAARGLLRRPLLSLTAGLSIALAIGGNAAIFSLADALLLRPRPGVAEPHQLVDVGRSDRRQGFDTFSYPTYLDLRDRNRVFSGLAAYDLEARPLGLATGSSADRVFGGAVSGNFFAVLGAPMALGRGFLPDDDRVGSGSTVTVISHALWRERFARDPSILGRVLHLNGRPFTVVGVGPLGFAGSTIVAADLWIPATAFPTLGAAAADQLRDRQATWLLGIGRLRPGVTLAQANVAMGALGEDLAREHPIEHAGQGIVLTPSHRLPGPYRPLAGAFVGLLAALVLLILLIACSNVAGMLLARGLERSREVAVRLAIGGGRARIVGQLLTESLLLASAGAAGGVLGAFWMTRLVARLQLALPVRLGLDVRVDGRVMAFSIGFTLLAAVLAGLVPALQAARTDPAVALRATMPHRAQRRLLQGFVTAQVAMSVLLVVGGLLFGRALARAGDIDPGFEAPGVELFDLDLRLAGHTPASGLSFAELLLERTARLPEVRSAALTRVVPLAGAGFGLGSLRLPGGAADAEPFEADWNIVTGDYFATLRIPIVRGRPFSGLDRAGAPAVAIVNQTLARRAWGGEDPVGKMLVQDEGGDDATRSLLVVGVARDAKYRTLGEAPRAFIYVPLAQQYSPELSLLVRATPGTSSFPAIRSLLQRLDPRLPLVGATSLPERAAIGLAPQRLAAWLSGGFGILGVSLAAIGIYGITAYGITRRRRELGVRAALGASRLALLRLVAGRALTVAWVGGVVGLAIAAVLARLLGSLLYGVPPLDPVSFAAAPALLGALTILATWAAARRAVAVDPAEILRSE